MNERENFILMSDAYKYGHYLFYPDSTSTVYSYGEARESAKYDKTVMFLMQYLMKKYFVGKVIIQEDIDEAKEVIDKQLGPGVFHEEGWQYILDEYDGRLPLEIRAIDEGTAVPKGTPLFTIVNTDPKLYWLPSFCETLIMCILWPGCSTATLTMETKKALLEYLDRTCDDPTSVIDFMFHNFGARSSAGPQAAAMTSAAHGLGFMGSDSTIGIPLIRRFYNESPDLYSVFALEHSITSAMGKEGEFKLVEKALRMCPTGILSYVIDTFNWKNFVKVIGTTYKEQILERAGKFVFRPDSGDPVSVTLAIVKMLDKYFGSTVNNKGKIVLNPKVGVLWGDGADLSVICKILNALEETGYSAENLVVGQGGALTHSGISRDMQGFAIKSSYQVANDISINIFKDPIDGGKTSKKGMLAVIKVDGVFKTLEEVEGSVEGDLLKLVLRNGELMKEFSYSEVKENLLKSW